MNSVLLGLLVVSAAVFMRLAVSLHPYSGAGNPPMFGDYEAQRHWMEITYHTSLAEWYHNTPDNNLSYWGLDYPPLTAYHSWLCGAVASWLNPEWVALKSSHGYESYEAKLFMRYSVFVVDVLVFFTGVAAFVKCLWIWGLQEKKGQVDEKDPFNSLAVLKCKLALLILLQPGLILIDYGHFQFNCASLGLALWAVVGVITEYPLLGSLAFTLALNYKQMELYHALPFFFYLLGKSFRRRQGSVKSSFRDEFSMFNGTLNVAKLGFVVILTILVLWLPFFNAGGLDGVLQVLRRLFPFNRGLYEDKVANFWCSISVIVKVRQIFSQDVLLIASTGMTLIGALPACLYLLWRPRPYNFLIALVTSSLSFFMFSFQVHEKSILLACLPVSLLTTHHPFLVATFQLTAAFSMYPLLTQDHLCLAVWALCCLYSLLCVLFLDRTDSELPVQELGVKALVTLLLSTLLTLCALSHIVCPPTTLPHIFPVLISAVSFMYFVFFHIYLCYLTFTSHTHQSERGFHWPHPFGIRGTREWVKTWKTD